MKNLIILGSTGSIGTQALDVVRTYREDLSVLGLAAGSNAVMLEEQIREFHPRMACLWDEAAARDLRIRVADLPVKVVCGMEGLLELAQMKAGEEQEEAGERTQGDVILLNAVVGMIGIRPTLAAIASGKTIALANKETLVTAGHLIMPAAAQKGVPILPVDSEHSAIFQCMNGEPQKRVSRILLTCSGGTFRGKKREQLVGMTARDALKNPNWDMGAKVTIDSASLVNKGLEVMEAKWLFGVDVSQIQVVVQPQSLVHSMVEYVDGSVMAHLAAPDMRLPIQYAFFYPDRRPLEIPKLDLFSIGQILFEKPDTETFRGLALAYRAAREGGSMPTVFNAANEEAVALFRKDQIHFLDIYDKIEGAMEAHRVIAEPTLEQILETEREAREAVRCGGQS
ncbi:MAG: 1-deoxy-D-xylulose-5-phosphate reductoisomerase [Eubacteriales bacterium]|nr:1-deoxy-D-xylulose-5-phosphate reductoisomerase [Eubacteriales bacterium]